MRGVRTDSEQRGALHRLLMPQSSEPRGRLTSWAEWLRQYALFRETDSQSAAWPELE